LGLLPIGPPLDIVSQPAKVTKRLAANNQANEQEELGEWRKKENSIDMTG
jgi:hypothetical protein